MQRWLPDYQTRDRDIVDYDEFTVPGCDVKFRGPGFDPFTAEQDSFFTCIGAAQTYGCFYEPFSKLLADRIGLKALNLAVGGAAPGFYLQYPSLIDAIRRSKFVVLQAMAARQETNSRFEADGHVEFLRDRIKGDSVSSAMAWRRVLEEDFDNAPRYVAETRQSWLETTRKLLDRVKAPVIYFWFSQRGPDYEIDWKALGAQKENAAGLLSEIWGDHPHLVDGPTARSAAAMCDAEAYSLSGRGMGAMLVNRHTGQPINGADYKDKGLEYLPLLSGRNDYYPSAEMHEDAADALEPVARRLIG
jgi:hypothetical protein